jgi:hypothetical protein
MTHYERRNAEGAFVNEALELRSTDSNRRDLYENFSVRRLGLLDVENL